MTRYVYGHDYRPPSKFGQNLLIAIVIAIAVLTFVWKTYDPGTLRLMSGVQPAAEKTQPAAMPQRIDTKQSGVRDKGTLR